MADWKYALIGFGFFASWGVFWSVFKVNPVEALFTAFMIIAYVVLALWLSYWVCWCVGHALIAVFN